MLHLDDYKQWEYECSGHYITTDLLLPIQLYITNTATASANTSTVVVLLYKSYLFVIIILVFIITNDNNVYCQQTFDRCKHLTDVF